MFLPQAFSYPEKSSPDENFAIFVNPVNFGFGFGNSRLSKFIQKQENNKSPKSLLELKKEVSGFERTASSNLILGNISDNIIKLSLLGNIFFLLKRNGKISILNAPSITTVAISGRILPNDEYIICTKETYDILDEIDTSLTFDKFISEFSKKIQTLENITKIKILFLKFTENHGESILEKEEIKEEEKEKIIGNTIENSPQKSSKILPFILKTVAKINIKIIKIFAILVGLILVGSLILNAVLKITKDAKKRIAEESQKIEKIQSDIEKAKGLLDLNNVRSKEISTQALNELKKIDLNKVASNENKQKIQELITSLEKIIKDSSGVVNTKAKIAYSTTLLKKESTATSISSENDEIAILDSKQKLVYFVNLTSKKAQTFALSKLTTSPKFLIKKGDYIFVFDESGVIQINIVSGKIQTAFKADSQWKNIVDIQIFNDNIYLLDQETNQIWKYIKNDTGFSGIQSYFGAEKPENPVSFAIDMAVYTLEKSTVKKYLSGDIQGFVLKTPEGNKLQKPVNIITSEDLENIYLLEPSQKRIIIYNKKGEYQKQIIDNLLEKTGSFGVNEKSKEIYFPIGSDIYKITF
jgi:hypothetical protein